MILLLWLSTLSATLGSPLKFDAVCKKENPSMCSQPMQKGERAPFGGQLLTPSLALDMATKIETGQKQCDLRIKQEREISEITERLTQELWAQDKVAHDKQIKLLRERLEEAKRLQKPPWYERPAFVAIVSVLVTTGAIAGAIKGVEALK
jgi:hypothetical protein